MTMNKTLIKTAERYEETARRLLEKAKLLRAGIDPNKCIYGEYTNEPFNTHGCKTCGAPKVVICNNKKVVGKRRNSKGCNPWKCKHFESLKLNT